jgi:hypothetical protein
MTKMLTIKIAVESDDIDSTAIFALRKLIEKIERHGVTSEADLHDPNGRRTGKATLIRTQRYLHEIF